MYPYFKAASMVTMVAMVGNSVGNSAKKSVVKFWSTSWSLQTLVYLDLGMYSSSCLGIRLLQLRPITRGTLQI